MTHWSWIVLYICFLVLKSDFCVFLRERTPSTRVPSQLWSTPNMKANNGHGYHSRECFGRDRFADILSFPLNSLFSHCMSLEQYCSFVAVFYDGLAASRPLQTCTVCIVFLFTSVFLLLNPVYIHTFALFKLNRYLCLCIKCCGAKGSLNPTPKNAKTHQIPFKIIIWIFV